jgi:hypothetical protein
LVAEQSEPPDDDSFPLLNSKSAGAGEK